MRTVVVALAALLAAGCTASSHPAVAPRPAATTRPAGTPSTPVPGTSPAATLASGVYEDGPTGMPRYRLALTVAGGVVSGIVFFIAQDGNRLDAHTFTGQGGPSGAALRFDTGQLLIAAPSRSGLDIDGCQAVLRWATTRPACTFTLTNAAAGGVSS